MLYLSMYHWQRYFPSKFFLDVEGIAWILLYGFFASTTFILFVISWLKDPGIMKNRNKTDIMVNQPILFLFLYHL